MGENKWTYIIGIDLVLGIILCVLGCFQELAFVFVTFFVMCISGIVGLVFLFSEEDRDTGYALLFNILIIPFLFFLIFFIGDYCEKVYNKLTSDDVEYEIDYKDYQHELILHGDKYYKAHSWDSRYKNYFDINPISDTSPRIIEYGNYQKIDNNRYLLIRIIPYFEAYSKEKDRKDFLIKDTLLLSNDTLYYFYCKPVLVRKRNWYRKLISL